MLDDMADLVPQHGAGTVHVGLNCVAHGPAEIFSPLTACGFYMERRTFGAWRQLVPLCVF